MKRRRRRNLFGRLCGAVAMTAILAWASSERLGAWAWASTNHRWAAEIAAGRVILHYAERGSFIVDPTGVLNDWPGWFDRLPGDLIPLGEIFSSHFPGRLQGRAWVPTAASSAVGRWMISVPVWCLSVPFTAAALVTERRHRRLLRCDRSGNCPLCNYNRTGLATDAVCPECGDAP